MSANPTEAVLHDAQELYEENQRLRAELKQQEKLYEQAHLELIQHMVESERQAKELKRLNSLLTKAYLNTIEIIQRLIELREPGYTEHANRVAEMSRAIALTMQVNRVEAQQIYIAARIHEIGKMSIPDAILKRPVEELSEEEKRVRFNHYLIGANLLSPIPSFRKVSEYIRSIGEHVDGTGLPEGLEGDTIPLGSRIIAMVNHWDSIFFMSQTVKTPLEGLQEIERFLGSRYDSNIFPLLHAEVLKRFSDNDVPRERHVCVLELTEGMELARDLKTVTNVLLVPAGTRLTKSIIQKIQHYQQIDPIAGGVYVKREIMEG